MLSNHIISYDEYNTLYYAYVYYFYHHLVILYNDSGTIITMLAAYEHETIENMIACGITYGDKQIKNLIFDFIAAHHDELMPDSA